MSERWQQYFQGATHGRSALDYAVAHWAYSMPLYQEIKRCVPPPARVLEIGCGLGYSTVYLQECGYRAVGVDNDEDIVRVAVENARRMESPAEFAVADGRDLTRFRSAFDLAFSIGVVEHFERSGTIGMLREQAAAAAYVVTVVPTPFTRYAAPVTDERFYGVAEFRRMYREAGLRPLRSFGYGDIPAAPHVMAKRLLPYGLWRLLQNRFAYAMGMGLAGASGTR
jgi:SAM-dependent methyltransferase